MIISGFAAQPILPAIGHIPGAMRLHNRESAEDDAPELEELGRPDHVDHDALRKIRDLVDELDRRE